MDNEFIKTAKVDWQNFARDPHAPQGEKLARPVMARSVDMLALQRFESHQHNWGQIAFAAEGILSIRLPSGHYTVPPEKALWIPQNVDHEIGSRYGAKFRSLYVDPAWGEALSQTPYVFTVSNLLRELILAFVELPENYALNERNQHLLSLLLDEIKLAPQTPLFIPMPNDPRLTLMLNTLQQNPADNTPLIEWQTRLGASARTINRIFNQQTGMGFSQWRQRLRVLFALEQLAHGMSVTEVAFNAGYDSSSAFITMFKKHLGKSPSRYSHHSVD